MLPDLSKPPGTCSRLPASHLYEARLMIEPAYGLIGPSLSRGLSRSGASLHPRSRRM